MQPVGPTSFQKDINQLISAAELKQSGKLINYNITPGGLQEKGFFGKIFAIFANLIGYRTNETVFSKASKQYTEAFRNKFKLATDPASSTINFTDPRNILLKIIAKVSSSELPESIKKLSDALIPENFQFVNENMKKDSFKCNAFL